MIMIVLPINDRKYLLNWEAFLSHRDCPASQFPIQQKSGAGATHFVRQRPTKKMAFRAL